MQTFKKLYKSIKQIKSALANPTLDTDLELLHSQLAALMELYTYLHSFKWLKQDKYRDKVKMYLDSNFDADRCATLFKAHKVNSFETSMSYASNKFTQAIGSSTIDLILQGEVTSALLHFQVCSGSLSIASFIPDDLAKNIKPKTDDSLVLLSECEHELAFFQSACLIALKRRLKELDPSKLSFIREILESKDTRYARLREYLYAYMLGSIPSIDVLLETLREDGFESIV